MKIISFNANGLRSAASKGFFEWFAVQDADAGIFVELADHGLAVGDQVEVVVKDARLAMGPPNWREYLSLPVQPIAAPQGLSVETAEEEKAWRDGASTGWYAGITEARRGFVTSWNILNRDYGGMLRYHDLAKQGVVSLPNLQTEVSKWRVTEGGTRAHSGERTLRLVVAPKFRKRG